MARYMTPEYQQPKCGCCEDGAVEIYKGVALCAACLKLELEETMKTYDVFHRTWWRARPDGREPGIGPKQYLAYGVTEAEARELCEEYNSMHEPGPLSDRAEFEEA